MPTKPPPSPLKLQASRMPLQPTAAAAEPGAPRGLVLAIVLGGSALAFCTIVVLSVTCIWLTLRLKNSSRRQDVDLSTVPAPMVANTQRPTELPPSIDPSPVHPSRFSDPPPTPQPDTTPRDSTPGSARGSSASLPSAPAPTEIEILAPFADFDGQAKWPLLPKRKGVGIGMTPADGALFTSLNLRSLDECKLELVGIKEVFGNLPVELQIYEPNDQIESRRWNIVKKKESGVGRDELIGTFRLDRPPHQPGKPRSRDLVPHPLMFQWNHDVRDSAKPDVLPYCLLKIIVGDNYRLCRLSEPAKVDALTLTGSQGASSPSFESSWLADIKDLQLELQPAGIAQSATVVQEPAGPVAFGHKQHVLVKNGNDQEGPRVGIVVELKSDEKKKLTTITLLCKAGYKTSEVSDEQAVIDGLALDDKLIHRQYADARKRVNLFETSVKRLEATKQSKAKGDLDAQIRQVSTQLNELQRQLASAKKIKAYSEMSKLERELDEWASEKSRLELQLLQFQADVESKKVDLAKAKEDLKRFEAIQKLVESLRNARVEYRIFFAIDREGGQFEIVDLYRSKGFTDNR